MTTRLLRHPTVRKVQGEQIAGTEPEAGPPRVSLTARERKRIALQEGA